jgi:nanoRNase/pAp phosphatase (c-di-AMP/oligoRNAs hydrolase)
MHAPRTLRSTRLLQTLSDAHEVFVVTHDNPDPDALAAGWGVVWLVQQRLAKPARLLGGGEIVRAENREMVDLLGVPIELVGRVECPEGTAVVLVDCSPDTENHRFTGHHVALAAAIDHHQVKRRWRPLPFEDCRPAVAASATIVADYLRQQRLVPPTDLATAMLYAIRTETSGGETHHSRLDRSVVRWLSGQADPARLAEIQNAPLSPQYFADLLLALQSTFLYGDVAFCLLPRARNAEIVGEVADLLLRSTAIRRVLCGAVVHGDLVLSIRTDIGAGDATELVHRTLAGLGQGGGHQHRAGGKISRRGLSKIEGPLREELLRRWLAACQTNDLHGVPLVPHQEIVKNLTP